MPDAGPDREPADELGGLLTERDSLYRRLAWVDTQVAQLQRERQDDLVRRLASLEDAVLRLVPSGAETPAPEPAKPEAPAGDWFAPAAPATPTAPSAVEFADPDDVDESPSAVDWVASRTASEPVVEHWSAPPSRPLAQPARPPAPARPDTPPPWSRPGFMPKLLALVGAAVTLIGVGFLLSLAAQNGLFPPPARTIAAALLGLVLVGLAFVVRARDPGNVGAPILGATGVAAGFISVVTATVLYFLLPPLVGVVLAALIGLGGMVLARLWNNEWVGLVSVLGSLLLAVYIGTRSEPVITAGLMLVLTGVTLWFERGTGWRLFPFARVLPTVMVLLQLTWRASGLDPAQLWWLVALTVVAWH